MFTGKTSAVPRPSQMDTITRIPLYHKKPIEDAFSEYANKKITLIQLKIEEYNKESERNNKLKILYEVNALRKELEDTYSQDFDLPAFKTQIQDKLFKECRTQFAAFDLSMHDKALIANDPSLPNPLPTPVIDPFANMLANMQPEEVQQLFKALTSHRRTIALLDVFKPRNPEYQRIINGYSLSPLGGRNSTNFTLTQSVPPFSSCVLKIDNRLGGAREMDTHLRKTPIAKYLTPIEATRSVTIAGDGTRSLLMTSLCPGGTPNDLSKRAGADSERIDSALDIYKQMSTVFLELEQEGCLFPDAKNSNWLLDEHGKLVIADTKSLLFSKGKHYDKTYEKNRWIYGSEAGIIHTKKYSSPEMRNPVFNVDKMNSYILGKNLFQYLTQCNDDELLDAPNFKFDRDIFKPSKGKALQELIEKMIKTSPNKRISIADALIELHNISNIELNATQHIQSEPQASISTTPSMDDITALKKRGEQLIEGMKKTSNRDDSSMKDFLCNERYFITVDTLENLKLRIQNLEPIAQENKRTEEFIKNTLKNLRNKSWSLGTASKSNAIKEAFYKIPVLERSTMMTTETPSTAVKSLRRALGTQRTLWGNIAPDSPDSSKIYQKYKQRFDELKPPDTTSSEEKTTTKDKLPSPYSNNPQ